MGVVAPRRVPARRVARAPTAGADHARPGGAAPAGCGTRAPGPSWWHAAEQTSLGEQQRTALLRALVLGPALAVLDEPAGHQDDDNVVRVIAALVAARTAGTTVVATHDERVTAAAGRVVRMAGGRVVPSVRA